jgi:hypothetical protein
MSNTPETDLEDDLYIDCDNPCYNCPVVKESTGEHLTCDFVPAEFARRLERERDNAISRFEALKEFCETELSWMYFRAEFLESKADSSSKTIENAQALQAYLKELK